MAKQKFVIVYESGLHPRYVDDVRIIVDAMTGVQYLSNSYRNGNGLTVLLDQDGKPLLYRG